MLSEAKNPRICFLPRHSRHPEILSSPSLCAKAVHVAPSREHQKSREDAFELRAVCYT
jgi:hypothetical protein